MGSNVLLSLEMNVLEGPSEMSDACESYDYRSTIRANEGLETFWIYPPGSNSIRRLA